MIAVVIPFFQRQPGILQRALRSIAKQTFDGAIRVVVVDDSSPIPANGEVAAIRMPARIGVDVVKRANGGPGAARNTGLDLFRHSDKYVAFLDSDDAWADDHLARAVEALDDGHDFFFANHLQLYQSVGAFERAGRIVPADHCRLETSADDLYGFRGDLVDQVLFRNPVGTSTVVFSFRRFGHVRFDPRFTSMGEDYLFWMTLGAAGANAAFSTRIAATYGRGVNVFSGSGWGTDGHLLRVHQEIMFKREAGRRFRLNDAQRDRLEKDIASARLMFARVVLHRLAKGKRLQGAILFDHLRRDPVSLLMLPRDVLRAAFVRGQS